MAIYDMVSNAIILSFCTVALKVCLHSGLLLSKTVAQGWGLSDKGNKDQTEAFG